jgi:hypothetical protein
LLGRPVSTFAVAIGGIIRDVLAGAFLVGWTSFSSDAPSSIVFAGKQTAAMASTTVTIKK